jgi:radical SAM protein with 4Fe4S-binding SPASM domain
LKSIGSIDYPSDLEEVGRFIRIKGWVVTSDSVIAELYSDNKPLGSIHTHIERPDVKKAYPKIDISKPPGFDQIFSMPNLSKGIHTLSLRTSNKPSNIISSRKIRYNDDIDYMTKIVGIEMSTKCNFHCDMCPAHSEKSKYTAKKEFADTTLIDKVIPFLEKFSNQIERIDAGAVWGEPLADSRYFENTRKIAGACPKASIDITTNGSFLTNSNIEKLLNLNNLRYIHISVDAGTKETYEKIRKGGKWETLNQNISELIKARKNRNLKRPLVSTNFVLMKNNFRELPQYVKKMAELNVDTICAVHVHNAYTIDSEQGIFDLPWKTSDIAKERDQVIKETLNLNLPNNISLNLPSCRPAKPSGECSFNGASTMIIGVEGDVYPCCVIQSLDYEGKSDVKSMGNFFQKDLEYIRNSDEFVDFRKKMLTGKAPNSICLNCPFFYGM